MTLTNGLRHTYSVVWLCITSILDFGSNSHGELVVAIGSRVSRKTVNFVGRGPAYQESGESHIARQQ